MMSFVNRFALVEDTKQFFEIIASFLCKAWYLNDVTIVRQAFYKTFRFIKKFISYKITADSVYAYY
jgi:hypothetical protein